MNLAFLTVVLAVFWAAATGNFSLPNLIFGALIGAIGLFVVRDRVQSPRLLRKAQRVVSLIGLFIYELFLSAFRVALLVIRPDISRALKPAIIAFPLHVKTNAEITLLANLITLTPGTLSVDVSDDGTLLYVHAIDCADKDALISDIARGFETKVAEVFE